MDNKGYIEIHIEGNKGANRLSPENFDIKEIVDLLSDVENILYPNRKVGRPDIAYSMESGSVRNIFTTTKQVAVSFAATATLILQSGNLDGLDTPTAQAFEHIQNIAKKKSYHFGFKLADSEEVLLNVTPETNYMRTASLWVDAEFYLYGILTNAGGKDKPNIHLDTKDIGHVIIATDKAILKEQERNMLYKKCGVRVSGKQRIDTGGFDKTTFRFLNFIDHDTRFNIDYLDSLMAKVGDKFKDMDVDKYISEIRGGYA